MIRIASVLFVLLPLSAHAQERQPAPEIFVTSAMATSTAQILAVNCPVLSIDPGAMAQSSSRVLEALDAAGFDPDTLVERMEDPSARIAVLQDAFLAKHGLADGAPGAEVCAAGLREISEGTDIGALLVEVEG